VSATALSEGTERESRALACEAAVRVVAALMNDTHDDSDCPNPEDLSEPTPLVEIFDPFLSQSSAEPIDVTAALEPMTSPQSTRTHDEYHLPDTAAGTACSPAAITAIEKTLTSRHPWIGDQIEAIFRSQRLRALAGPVHPQFPPMLLAGPTGSGKTTLARAIAQVTGLPFWYTSAGGRSGALEFAASSPLLQRSAPSLGIRAMVSLRCVNPIIIVDDLDKFGDSRVNGDPYSALSTLVENHSSRTLVDDYLGRPVDMSQISWIFTATETSTIPGQMLDRLDVYSIDKPSPEFFDAVLALCMEDIAREAATSTWHLPSLDDAVLDALRRSYRRGRSLRRMKAALRQALGIAEGQKMIN
ncbi:AAA family ATPase, partial [Camelimonas fluminis]